MTMYKVNRKTEEDGKDPITVTMFTYPIRERAEEIADYWNENLCKNGMKVWVEEETT